METKGTTYISYKPTHMKKSFGSKTKKVRFFSTDFLESQG